MIEIEHSQSTMRFLARDSGKIIGTLAYSFPDDSSRGRNLSIDSLIVNSLRRREGIGTALVKALLDHFRSKVIWVSLWTGEQAEIDKSWSIFLKLDFQQGPQMPDYYRKGVGTRYFYQRIG